MKIYEFIVVTVIFVILLVGILVGGEINRKIDVQNTYNADFIEEKRSEGVNLEIDSEKVQEIYPFTGAFPTNELLYLTKLKNVDRANMTNEFILRMGFAKVTKEDWQDSYTGEGEPLEIDAKVLENYIEDVFGNIEYTHSDFYNRDLTIDEATSCLYKNEYNEENDTYTIYLEAGDGVGESYVDTYNIKATQYGDKIEIVVNPIYIYNMGQKKNENGEYNFYYKCYSSYDLKNKKFEGELTEEIESGIYESYANEFVDELKNISLDKLETYILTYKLNGKTNKFEFESLRYEEPSLD